MECIILAGGLGTRLRDTIGDVPKCMAQVDGKPFLYHVFEYLEEQGCTRIILSLGHKHEVILKWMADNDKKADYVIENEQLGTGGGIRLAMEAAEEDQVVVLNGDTMFRVDLNGLLAFHDVNRAATTLALKEMHDFDRYGSVNINDDAQIVSFEEKKHMTKGLINGGVYAIDRHAFLHKNLPEKFSFEKNYLEAFVNGKQFFGYPSEAYFIDIGIPEDYQKAQIDAANNWEL